MRAEDNRREAIVAGHVAGLGLQPDPLRPGTVAVRQRAVQFPAVLGNVRGQNHVQAADRRRGVQNRHNRVDQLSPEPADQALQKQPVPGDVQAGAEPGQARAGRHLRPGDRVAGQFLRDPGTGPGPDLVGDHVLHQEVLLHRQLQPCSKGVQPVPDAHHDHVHAARKLRPVLVHVAGGRVQNNSIQVVRPVQGPGVRVEGRRRFDKPRDTRVDGYRLPGADQRELRVPVGLHAAVRRLLLPYRDGIQQKNDIGLAQTARARRSRQAVSVEQAERVHKATGQASQSGRKQRRNRRVDIVISVNDWDGLAIVSEDVVIHFPRCSFFRDWS